MQAKQISSAANDSHIC